MKRCKSCINTLVLLVISLALLLVSSAKDPLIIETAVLHHNNSESTIELPFSRDLIGTYRVEVSFSTGDQQSATLNIVPDDELLAVIVNGRPISLAGFSYQQLRNYNQGIDLHLTELRANATNVMTLKLRNGSNPTGLNVRMARDLGWLSNIGIVVALAMLVFSLCRHISLTLPQQGLVLVSLLVSVLYLSVTEPNVRTFDVYEGGGHRDYIHYLIEHKKLPPPGEGWEYHQPPAYYLIAALTKSLFVAEGADDDLWGQLLALWFWAIFLVATLGSLKTYFGRSSLPLLLASFALCFWPTGIMHSIRIGNDVPLYAFYALGFYFLLRWWHTNANSHLIWASAWAALALLTKSNALAVWGILGLLFLLKAWRWWRSGAHKNFRFRKLRQAFFILAGFFTLSMTLNLGDNLWHYITGESSDWLLSNVSHTIHSGLQVDNTPTRYLIFDVATYLQNPFISTWHDVYGRQYFWNFVWRSALSSEFFFDGTAMKVWGVVNGLLLMMMLIGTGLYFIQWNTAANPRTIRFALYRNLPWLLGLVLPFLLLLAYRIKVPLSCNTDFRYIYPVLLQLVFFSVLALRQKGFIVVKTLTLGAPLIGMSSFAWLYMLISQ